MRSARPNLARSSDLGSGFFGGKKAKDSAYMMRARAVALARYAVDDAAILVRGCGRYVPSRGWLKGWGATTAWRLGDGLNAGCRWSRARLSSITLQAKSLSESTSPSTVHGAMLCTLHPLLHGALLYIFPSCVVHSSSFRPQKTLVHLVQSRRCHGVGREAKSCPITTLVVRLRFFFRRAEIILDLLPPVSPF